MPILSDEMREFQVKLAIKIRAYDEVMSDYGDEDPNCKTLIELRVRRASLKMVLTDMQEEFGKGPALHACALSLRENATRVIGKS